VIDKQRVIAYSLSLSRKGSLFWLPFAFMAVVADFLEVLP
jgi:hypothetical protein